MQRATESVYSLYKHQHLRGNYYNNLRFFVLPEIRVAIKRNVILSRMPTWKVTITNVMVTNLGPERIQETLAAASLDSSGFCPVQLRLTPRSAQPGDPFCKNIKILIVRAALRWKITTGPLIEVSAGGVSEIKCWIINGMSLERKLKA